jgi:hypothetical protein
VIDVGDNTALPALAQVEEKLTVTGDAEEAPVTLTVITDAPYALTLGGLASTKESATLTAETVKVVRVVSVDVVETSATADT